MFQKGAVLNTQSWGNRPENLEIPFFSDREPLPTDINYPVGKHWLYEGDSEWVLLSLSTTSGNVVANWQNISQNGSQLTITGDDNVPLSPVSDNWNIVGQKNGVIPVMQTTGAASTLSIEDRTSTTAFVVDPDGATPGQRGTFSTIQSAVSAASAGTTVFIKAGTYTENVVLKNGVDLASYGNSGMTPTVNIIGRLILNTSGRVTLSGLGLQTNGNYAISVIGSNTSALFLIQCNIVADNFAAIQLSNTGTGSSIRLMNCWGRTNTDATNFFVATGTGSLTFWNVNILDPTPQTIASTFASTGQLLVKYSILRFPIETSGTGRISGTDSEFNTFATNTTSLVVNSTSGSTLGNYIRGCILLAGNTTALTIGAGATVNMLDCTIITTSTDPILGTGTLNQSCTSFSSTNALQSSTSLTVARKAFDAGALWGNWSGVAPAAGFVGEQISSVILNTSPVPISTNTDTNVTSIILTAGTWDISGIVMFNSMPIMTRQVASIGSASALITVASYGNNTISSNYATTVTAGDTPGIGLSIPSFRENVPKATGTRTIYLKAKVEFTDPVPPLTGEVYGRISATRVC